MLALMAAAAWMTATSGETYGGALLARELTRHGALSFASIDLDDPPGGHFEAGTKIPGAREISLAVADGLGVRLGTLTLRSNRAVRLPQAQHIAADIARHVYSKTVLGEPVPFVAGAFLSSVGDHLIERELDREPGLVTIALHVALPGRQNQIIASNFGRIGKAADADDQRVIRASSILQEVTNGGKRLAVELPLLDRSRRTIGALSTSFIIGPDGRTGAYQSALRVQRDLSRSVQRIETLAR